MNREIDFRAWDKKNNIWVKHNQLLNKMQVQASVNPPSILHIKHEDWILMQYTGLKDKNGKKIYEGDIVKNYNQDVMVVKYIPPSFVADYFPLHHSEIIRAELKVIGNICKYPELLERAKNDF